MIREEINFLEGCEFVTQEKKPRQIRTKSTSFSQIKKHFIDFSIRLLNKKLEREKDKALTEGYKDPASKRESEKMMRRASAIARLEEKIKILGGKDVPFDYVNKRAIKIKKAMMEKISYTSNNIYAVGLENKKEVFNSTETPEVVPMDPEVQEAIAAKVKAIMEEEAAKEAVNEVAAVEPVETPVQEEVAANVKMIMEEEAAKEAAKEVAVVEPVETPIQEEVAVVEPVETPVQEVVATVEPVETPTQEEVAAVERVETPVQEVVAGYEPDAITKAEIKAEIDRKLDEIKQDKAQAVEETKLPHIDLAEIQAVVNDAFKEMQDTPEASATIGSEEIEGVVEESFKNVDVDSKISLKDIKSEFDEAMDKIVSKNAKTDAKIDRFNEDGSVREKYTYTPMTDEEIKAASENIEYDKYKEVYRQEHEPAQAAREAQAEEEAYVYKPMTDEEIKAAQANIEYDKYEEIYRQEHEQAKAVSEAQAEEETYVYKPMTDEEIKAAQANIEYDKYEEIYRQEHEQAKAASEAQAEEETYVYKPMTDEEIKAAQANIEYDKYEEIYKMQNATNFKTAAFKDIFKPADKDFNIFDNKEEAVREVPVIVPEMDGNRFTSQEVREEVKPGVVSKPTSIEAFAELKAKVEELKKKLAESENKKNTAIKFAERTSDRAEEIKRSTIASEKAYQDKLASLQLLAQTLEENCKLNDTAAHAAAIDAECNERFICLQQSKKEQYDEAIIQVDSILNFTYEESRGKGRAA